MTITLNDIKLLASERLTDDADGGGFMTATPILDGVENNLFPDVSEIDRAQGAVDYRKAFGAVLADNTDVYYGAHVIIDAVPGDTAVSALLVGSSGVAEQRSSLLTRLNSDAVIDPIGGGSEFRGTKPLQAIAATGDRLVKIGGLAVALVPTSNLGVAASGAVVASDNSTTTGNCLVPAGTTATAPVVSGKLNFYDFAIPGSVAGSVTSGVDTYTVSDTGEDQQPVLLEMNGVATGDTFHGSQTFPGKREWAWTGHPLSPGSVTYQPGLAVRLPRNVHEFTWAVGMLATQFITLPYQSERGSERVEWTSEDGEEYFSQNYGPAQFNAQISDPVVGSVNRSTRVVSLVFNVRPKVGTKVRIYYVRTGYAQALPTSAIGSGVFNANSLTVNTTSGWTLRTASFYVTGHGYYRLAEEGTIYSGTAVVGSFDPVTSKLLMLLPDGATVTEWAAVEVNNAIPVTSIADAQLPAFMNPPSVVISGTKAAGGTFSSTADASGAFNDAFVTGTYVKTTGKLTLSFAAAVNVQSLQYAGDVLEFTPVSEAVAGVDPAKFPSSGEVVAFRQGQVLVVHNTQDMAPATVTNGQTVSVGRDRIAEARVFGNDGLEISTGFSYSRALGTVTFTDVAGYSQPVTIRHRVEDMSVVIDAGDDGSLSLSRPLTHDFPATTSFASSALLIGDLQGRAHPGFAQATWLGDWSDTVSGTPPLADYDEVNHPLEVTNKGAITERWACIFSNTTTYRVIGEQVGEIAQGNTGTACSPLNPATGVPYFTIRPEGWGSGWAIGNVYRFSTSGGSAPFWTIRSIAPSEPYENQDRVAIALRGSINA